MKKYKSIAKAVLLSCTLALTTSCNDFLDKAPDDQLTMEMIFTDKIRTEDWLAMISLFPKIGLRIDGEVCMPTPPETGVLSQHGSPIIG